jgi:hypothetical protein
MKSSVSGILVLSCSCLLTPVLRADASSAGASAAPAGSSASADSAAAAGPVQAELTIVAAAQRAACADDDSGTDAQLSASGGLKLVPSVALARRAAVVCGQLQNDNEYPRAIKLAQRAIARLAEMKEGNDADREERLYWEALLEGRILDHKAKAIVLLEAARALKPDDDRVLDLDLEFSKAVAQFGH